MATRAGEQAISNAAVRDKTGRTWRQWHAILDRFDAAEKGHKETAEYLAAEHGLSSWWSQAVTVRYEQDRGLRSLGERADGRYELSVQRTIATTMTGAFDAWTNPVVIRRWFTKDARVELKVGGTYSNDNGDCGVFLRIDRPRRLRFTWENPDHCPGTTVEMTFTAGNRGRTAVRVQHMKLRTAKDREAMKQGWTWVLECMKSFLETGEPIAFETWNKRRNEARRI